MKCFKCGGDMQKMPYDGMLIDCCHTPGCYGVWVDGDEIRKLEHRDPTADERSIGDLVNQAKLEIAQEHFLNQDMPNHLCPRCPSNRMQQVAYHGVEVERCPACEGVFFDSGEFKKIRDLRRPWMLRFFDWFERHLEHKPSPI